MAPQTESKARAPRMVGLVLTCNGERVLRPEERDAHVSGAAQGFHALGPTQKLAGDDILHPYCNFREQRDKLDFYAQQGADALKAKGKSIAVPGVRAGFINPVHGSFDAFLLSVSVAEEGDWSPRP